MTATSSAFPTGPENRVRPRKPALARHDMSETEVRRFSDNGCTVTAIVADPADSQRVLYGTVARDGKLVGSYYCASHAHQSDWRIVTADGGHLSVDGQQVTARFEGDAVYVLTTILAGHDKYGIDQQLRDATARHDSNR